MPVSLFTSMIILYGEFGRSFFRTEPHAFPCILGNLGNVERMILMNIDENIL